MPGKNWLLTIGIDKYSGPRYQALDNCVRDAKRFKGIMEDLYGFETFDQPLYDEQATRENIEEALNALSAFTTPDDNVIIFFAGHGDQHATSKSGFWIPYNWSKSSDSVLNSTIFELIQRITAKHILLISDSCFSGTFVIRDRGASEEMTVDQLEALNSRWVFTSGSEEFVGDGRPGEGSPFSLSLCEFLQNNSAPKVPIGVMFEVVKRMTIAKAAQTPMSGFIRMPSNSYGQMVLKLQNTRPTSPLLVVKQSFPLPELPFEYYLSRTVTLYDYKQPEIAFLFDGDQNKISLQDALNKHSRIALLGSAGSGKSFELTHLGKMLDTLGSAYVPIYKRLNTYTGQDLEAFLPPDWDTVTTAAAVILLDGLDEIQNEFKYTAISKITEFCNRRPAQRIIISCRTNFYELPSAIFSGTLEGFSVFMLNDISLAEIRDYADKILQLDGKQFIREVYDASLLDVIQKPYFLDLLTKYYVKNGNFQVNRTSMYEEALMNYYAKDKEHFKNKNKLPAKSETFALLEKLAFVMEVMGKNFITEDELQKVLTSQEELDKCSYLPAFKKQEKTGHWMFEHNNIQEFLAARVLVQKPFEKLVDIISFSAAGKLRVKPTWANTLSFYISIGKKEETEKVLEWIANNDEEQLIRFEADRISDQKRFAVFKHIFESYSQKQIWLNSNKFSDSDLAKFVWMDEAIEYLLEKINSKKSSRITKLNAIRVIDNYNLRYFPHFIPEIKESLLNSLNNKDFEVHDMYSVIGALANLQITDKQTLDTIINKFRNRKNQYIRAGIYKLLSNSEHLEEHLDYLFEGLDFTKIVDSIEDRDSVNLMDESFHLKTALSLIKKPESIKQLLTHFASEESRSFYYSDYKEIITDIIETSIDIYKTDTSIYQYVRDYFVKLEYLYNQDSTSLVLPFFDQTGTKWSLFKDTWKNKKIERHARNELIETLITKETIAQFIKAFGNKEFKPEDAEEFHQIIFWKDRNRPEFKQYLQLLEEGFQKNFKLKLERPVLRNYDDVYKKKTQEAFDLLFDKPGMFQEVEKIFSKIGKVELTAHEMYAHRSAHYGELEDAFINSAVELIRNFTFHGRTVTLEDIITFFKNDIAFYNYQVDAIYEYLHGSNSRFIELGVAQLKFIKDWCLETGDVPKILWFFIHKFSFQLEEAKVLDLTFYYDFNNERKFDEPGTIEQLEKFVSRQTLKKKVAANLLTDIKDISAWLSNAGYAIRHNINEVYPAILSHLQRIEGNEYKYNEVLEFWLKKTGDTKRMTQFIESVRSDVLCWHAINLLNNTGKEQAFLNSYLKRIMNNEGESRDSRLNAANHLMAMNDLDGVAFATEEILKNPDPGLEFRHDLNRMSALKNAGAIPWLIRLLFLGRQPEYQKDHFNSLESVVIDALYNIGINSDENFILVRNALLKFMSDNEGILKNLNFLHFTIQRIEEQLSMKKSQDYSIEQALVEWRKSL